MKSKIYKLAIVAVLLVFTSLSSYAGDFEFSRKKVKVTAAPPPGVGSMLKGPISGGFYLLLGIGSPSYTYKESNMNPYYNGATYKMGLQYNLELGNQFLFFKIPDKFGIGMNASWITLGYSSYTRNYYQTYYTNNNNTNNGVNIGEQAYTFYNFDLRFIKFGPHATIGVKQLGIDISADVIPFSFIAGGGGDIAYAQYGVFSNFSFAVKARFKIFTAGVDITTGTNHYTDNVLSGTYNTSNFNPRFVFGFRF